ncbi:hypothetical protein PMAYCL1PPCAC_08157, partial [Pristionchus mayeri]
NVAPKPRRESRPNEGGCSYSREDMMDLADCSTLSDATFTDFSEEVFSIFEDSNPDCIYSREEMMRICSYEGYRRSERMNMIDQNGHEDNLCFLNNRHVPNHDGKSRETQFNPTGEQIEKDEYWIYHNESGSALPRYYWGAFPAMLPYFSIKNFKECAKTKTDRTRPSPVVKYLDSKVFMER